MDVEKSLSAFHNLLLFTQIESKICPWIKDLTFEDILGEAKSELNEVKNASNKELAAELGDLMRDVLLCILIANRDRGIQPLEKIIEKILLKVKTRKPWVENGIIVNKDEAVRIWNEVKNAENG